MAGRTTAGGWGAPHQRLRRQWARLVATGTVACARCGELIAPSAVWHLDHADDRNSYLGPSHAKCNLRAAGWKTGGRMASYPRDDPANGVFWGPPMENGQPRPWSKAWYDWRTERGVA
jgi:hypothetical protein